MSINKPSDKSQGTTMKVHRLLLHVEDYARAKSNRNIWCMKQTKMKKIIGKEAH